MSRSHHAKNYTPVSAIVSAWQWRGSPDDATDIIDWLRAHDVSAAYFEADSSTSAHISIRTPVGRSNAYPFDWVVDAGHGFIAVPEDVFDAIYTASDRPEEI